MNAQRRPVIGIADASKDGKNTAVPRSYIDAVLQAGGVPVVIPVIYDEKKVIELLNTMDGIVFVGGEDFDPAYYNERSIPQMGRVNVSRDEFEMRLVHLAAERRIPILGICRGLQLINIAFGGSLYQDLPAQYYNNTIRHRQKQPNDEASHAVYVEDNTVFADIVKERMLMVNSSHHQAIKKVALGFRVAGKSPDEIVEVIEKVDDENWILGVQFHPEARVARDNAMRRIFQRFMDEAGRQEKPDRAIKTVSSPRPQVRRETESEPQVRRERIPEPQIRRETESEPQIRRERIPEPVSPPQVIYKSVIDTQFIYKFVRDTQYIYAPADTVYISVSDTKYIQLPADTVYVSDTVYIAAPPKAVRNPDLPQPLPVRDKSKADTVEAVSDTLVFTPGTLDSVKISTNPDTLRSKKKEEKAKMKKEKKEAEEKQRQYQKEQMEKAKQKKKMQKEKEEQEKKAKKEQAEKDKQFKQQQKEKEKLDKKELEKKEEEKKEEEKKELEKKEAGLPVKQFDCQFDTCIVEFAVFVADKYAEIKDVSPNSIS
jgi:gamma-glutamyl-gamma-aminobutyrate hydrolase PuuD